MRLRVINLLEDLPLCAADKHGGTTTQIGIDTGIRDRTSSLRRKSRYYFGKSWELGVGSNKWYPNFRLRLLA
jgi:hypothetical protein